MKKFAITYFGDPILRKKSKKVPRSFIGTSEYTKLIENMMRINREEVGVAIASPQVGVDLALILVDIHLIKTRPDVKPQPSFVMINPKILERSEETQKKWEGCLSLTGVRAKTRRSKWVLVEYMNEEGEIVQRKESGFMAQIFQHEIDHINGVLFVDRVEDTKTYTALDEYMKRVVKKK